MKRHLFTVVLGLTASVASFAEQKPGPCLPMDQAIEFTARNSVIDASNRFVIGKLPEKLQGELKTDAVVELARVAPNATLAPLSKDALAFSQKGFQVDIELKASPVAAPAAEAEEEDDGFLPPGFKTKGQTRVDVKGKIVIKQDQLKQLVATLHPVPKYAAEFLKNACVSGIAIQSVAGPKGSGLLTGAKVFLYLNHEQKGLILSKSVSDRDEKTPALVDVRDSDSDSPIGVRSISGRI